MQNSWIFNCSSAAEALENKLQSEGHERGYRARLAAAASCQPAYLSQVIAGKALFTMDHAAGLCDFWCLEDLATEYFLNLVQLTRAGSSRLRQRIERRLREILVAREAQKGKLSHQPEDKEKVVEYYQDWVVAAVHVLVTVPGYEEIDQISRHLGVSKARVRKALQVLSDLQFVEPSNKGWKTTLRFFHASTGSVFARFNHQNWRARAVENSAEISQRKSVHYTALHVLSKSDFKIVYDKLLQTIEEVQTVVRPSPEETLSCLNLDWFEVGGVD